MEEKSSSRPLARWRAASAADICSAHAAVGIATDKLLAVSRMRPKSFNISRSGKRGRIRLPSDVLKLGFLAGGENDGGTQHIEEPVALQTRFQTEGDRFGQCLHSEAEQGVDAQLHRRTGTGRPDVEGFLAEDGQDRLASLVCGLVAATKITSCPSSA